MKRFFLLVSLAVLFTACESQIDVLNQLPEFEASDIIATTPDNTRTFLAEGNAIYWNVGDQLTVFEKSDHNLKYQVAELQEGSTTARFTYAKEYVLGSGAKFARYMALYPFQEEATVSSNYVITMNIPAAQYYDAKRDFKYVPLVAVSTSMNMNFAVPSSALRLRVAKDIPDDIILNKIIVSSASQDIAGFVDINMKQSTPTAVINTAVGVPSQSISLFFDDGIVVTEDEQSFYVALPPTCFGVNDLSITCVYDMNGDTYKSTTVYDAEIDFKVATIRSTKLTLTAPDLSGSTIVEDDLVVNGDMELAEPLVVPSGSVTITVEEGATLTNADTNINSSLIVVEEGAELTIDGNGLIAAIAPELQASALSTTTITRDTNTAFPIVVNGTLRIKGCEFSLDSFVTSWLDCGIYVAPGGKLIVEDGTFRSTKGSYIFGHEFGERPEIIIRGGRFEGYDPADNDFDGNGSNYLEPEYASYYVAEDELVVSTRDAEWEVDNSYLLNSILKNGGNATLIDSVDENYTFFVDDNISVNYPVNIAVSGDFSKVSGYCPISLNTPLNIYADVNIKCDYTDGDLDSTSMTPDESLLYVISSTAIANVYNGATLTLGDAYYFGGDDEVSETMFNLYGGNVVINGGDYVISERIVADNMFVVGDYYTAESSLVVNGGKFYGFNPETVAFGEEVRNCVAEGLCSYEISNLAYGIYAHGSAFDVDNIYLLRSIFKKGGRANIYGKITIDESLEALNPVVVNMGGAFENELNYTGSDAMMKCYSDITLIADNDLPYIYSESVVAEVYENAKLLVALNGALVGNAANTMFVAYGGQIDVMSGIFQPGGGVGFAVSEDYPDSMISVYGGTYFNNYNPAEFVAEGYTVNEYDGYNEVVALAF